MGKIRKASDYYEQSLDITREIGDRVSEGHALDHMGAAWRTLGEVGKAIEYHEQSLGIRRKIGDRRGEGNTLANSAVAYHVLGDREEAIQRAKLALAIFEAIEEPDATKVRAMLAEWLGGPT